jgi:hypothetical protein
MTIQTLSEATTFVPTTTDLNVTNKPEALALIKRAAELKAIISAAEKELKGTKTTAGVQDQVDQIMQGYNRAILRGVPIAVRSSPRTRTGYNADILKTMFPEAAKAAYTETPYTFFSYSV